MTVVSSLRSVVLVRFPWARPAVLVSAAAQSQECWYRSRRLYSSTGYLAAAATTPPDHHHPQRRRRRPRATEGDTHSSTTSSSALLDTSSKTTTTTTIATHQPHLFDKILIANRGEIASRIMRTCQRLGIQTVAIYSTADASAPFVHEANEALCVGPPTNSYLNVNAILQAALTTGAQAVHPGYGFLSENADFGRAVEEAGLVFLGPTPAALTAMGDKLQSKVLAAQAGVTIIPGHDGTVTSLQHARQLCDDQIVPYPVLLKAAAGGGGKGMRVCWNDRDLTEAWTVAKAEALKFFNDDRLLLEKYIEQPHHIEFQVVAAPNNHNNSNQTDVVVFPERECSIQRRNQKIIEETPSVLLTADTRNAMAEQVRRLCQTVGYRSAGTVEFLVDEHQHFYFLEMNTRLQVEHPITEAVTGVDLVEAMLYVGAGQGLPPSLQAFTEGIVPWRGHALEARLYAEDPLRQFLPSTGSLSRYVEPTTERLVYDDNDNNSLPPLSPPYVRLDSGVTAGQPVSPYYDPMLSKLIYYGTDRPLAIAGLRRALDDYVMDGVQHNARLVQSVLREPAFLAGATPTSFLDTHYPDGFVGVQLTPGELEEWAVAAVLIGLARQELLRQAPLTGGGGGADDDDDDDSVIVRLGGQFGAAYRVKMVGNKNMSDFDDDATATVQVLEDENGNPTLSETVGLRTITVDSELQYDPLRYLATLSLDGHARTLQVLSDQPTGELRLQMYGAVADVLLQSPREYELSRRYMRPPVAVDTQDLVLSPMPGLLISYAVTAGQTVEEGQELCIVESMKMQNMIRSPRRGVIAACVCDVGASLQVDQVIVTFETTPSTTP